MPKCSTCLYVDACLPPDGREQDSDDCSTYEADLLAGDIEPAYPEGQAGE